MYHLDTPLLAVKGIGPATAATLQKKNITTVKDLLLLLPSRYEDRSLRKLIYQLEVNELVTLEAEVVSASNYYKGRRSIQSATVKDHTGKLKLMWFNNPHVVNRLKKDVRVLVSGKLNDRHVMVQPTIETLTTDTIHTGRLVPIYPSIPDVAPATLRKLLKHIVEKIDPVTDSLSQDMDLHTALHQIHFPDTAEKIIEARERFALEELLVLIQHARDLKEEWQKGEAAIALTKIATKKTALPFALTAAQQRCVREILSDLQSAVPMNRLLVGDVGSGKTAVAGLACEHVLANGHHAAFVAPTQILAEQHAATFHKIFPHVPVQLLTGKKKTELAPTEPTLFIGTHAVLNQLAKITPALLIYDEQHRFGVTQRSLAQHLSPRPHILTLSATPIPRTLMLSIFAHLQLSMIDEMPPGRKIVKTWVVPEKKRLDAYAWIEKTLHETSDDAKAQALIVCPFIDPSETEGLGHIAAVTEVFGKIAQYFKKLPVAFLHGRMNKKEQLAVTEKLYAQEIQVLVTTPIVEVGVDLPAAAIIVIEAAERFGLASLHQMRGRVGRAGQEGYCLLFTNSGSGEATQRLKKFSETHNGIQLAEQDLQRRGAGDIFGTQQHGFDELQFASWSNLTLITKAKKIADQIVDGTVSWQPFLELRKLHPDDIPLAN